MDYSVGSLSDLITGKNTPNKKKVVTKKLEVKKEMNESLDSSNESDGPETQPIKKRKSLDKSEAEPKIKKLKKAENSQKGVARKQNIKIIHEDPEEAARTVFVGNVPVNSTVSDIKRLFTKYGKVEAVRIRGVPVANPKTPQKVAHIKKEYHPKTSSFYSFVRFKSREDAIKAADEANGIVFQDHHLTVHLLVGHEKPDESKAIFVGNLSFYAEEEDLWKLFESCGPIESVRIVRDKKTRIGKGFGYVNFQNSDSVSLALEMEDVKLKDRELRIAPCNTGAAKKNKKTGKPNKIEKPGKPKGLNRKIKQKNDENGNEGEQKQTMKGPFQGSKFSEKKKNKINKGLLQKKKMIKKIAPK